MIEIKFTFATMQEAADFMSNRAQPAEAPGKPTPEVTVKPAEKPSTKTKPEVTARAEPAATPAVSQPTAEVVQTAAPASPATEPVTYEKSGLAVKISQAAQKDKAAVVALLAEFGVKKGPELKPDQFDAFGAKIDALLEGVLA